MKTYKYFYIMSSRQRISKSVTLSDTGVGQVAYNEAGDSHESPFGSYYPGQLNQTNGGLRNVPKATKTQG